MTTKTVRVAAVQMESVVAQRSVNLANAARFVAQAAARGAELVLLPELMPGGYVLTEAIWQTAEPFEGAHFYNCFVLVDNHGEVAGRVRKSPPASVEAYFYRSGEDSHVFDTPLGRIGVAICYESLLYRHLQAFYEAKVDLVLQPASAPTPAAKFPLRQKDADAFDDLLEVGPQHYARALGVPVVMANKVGALRTKMPGGLPDLDTHFPGRSAIVDGNGEVKARLGAEESGVIVETIHLEPRNKTNTPPPRYGNRWALPVPWYSFIWLYTQWLGEHHYRKSKARTEAAKSTSL